MKNTIRFVPVLVCIGLLAGCGPATQENVISIKGSDTMLQLTNSWAEAYMEANPGVVVTVSGGGSGVGIAALINGTTDICMASREIREKEIEDAAANGTEVAAYDVALDGIAIVVNKNNPIEELTMAQLKALFTGEIQNWSELTDFDADVILLSRESSSGTFAFFSEKVLDKNDYAESALLLPSTTAIVDAAKTSEGGIGYVGLGYAEQRAEDIKVIGVKADESSPAIKPNLETVSNGSYVIARALNFYSSATNPHPLLESFYEFCRGAEGQKIVESQGYVPAL